MAYWGMMGPSRGRNNRVNNGNRKNLRTMQLDNDNSTNNTEGEDDIRTNLPTPSDEQIRGLIEDRVREQTENQEDGVTTDREGEDTRENGTNGSDTNDSGTEETRDIEEDVTGNNEEETGEEEASGEVDTTRPSTEGGIEETTEQGEDTQEGEATQEGETNQEGQADQSDGDLNQDDLTEYRVQVGLHRSFSNAMISLSNFVQNGYTGVVTPFKQYYAVQLGSFDELDDAADFEAELRQRGYDTLLVRVARIN